MEKSRTDEWAVRIGSVTYPAETEEDIRQWANAGSISARDQVWDPINKQWCEVGEFLQRERNVARAAATHVHDVAASEIAELVKRCEKRANLRENVWSLLVNAFGYAESDLAPIHSTSASIQFIGVRVEGRLRFVVGVTGIDVLAGEPASRVCALASDRGTAAAIITNGIRWLCFEQRETQRFEAVERIDFTPMLRNRRKSPHERLLKTGLLGSRFIRSAVRKTDFT